LCSSALESVTLSQVHVCPRDFCVLQSGRVRAAHAETTAGLSRASHLLAPGRATAPRIACRRTDFRTGVELRRGGVPLTDSMKLLLTAIPALFAASLGAGCASSASATRESVVRTMVAEAAPSDVGATRARPSRPHSQAAVAHIADLGNPADVIRNTERSLAERRTLLAEPPPFPLGKPRQLKPIRPAPEAVWVEGYWSYMGHLGSPYEWMSGHWEIPPPGARTWVPGDWQRFGNNFVYVRGHWR
jgi:hypothetical protein